MPLPSYLPLDMLQSVPEPEWIVQELLPCGYLAILASEPKVGKSCLATAIALAVASGQPFATLPTKKAPVLWYCLEESLQERASVLKLWKTPETELFTSSEPLRIDEESGIERIEQEVHETQAKLVVIDPLYAATGGYSLGEANLARRSLTRLKKFCARHGVTGLVLHHMFTYGRPGHLVSKVAESAQLAATASMQMLLTSLTTPGAESRQFKLSCRGRGHSVNRDWHFRSTTPSSTTSSTPPTSPPQPPAGKLS